LYTLSVGTLLLGSKSKKLSVQATDRKAVDKNSISLYFFIQRVF
jgi:hypothetical protein